MSQTETANGFNHKNSVRDAKQDIVTEVEDKLR